MSSARASVLHRGAALSRVFGLALLTAILFLPAAHAGEASAPGDKPAAGSSAKRRAASNLDVRASAETSFYSDDTDVDVVTPTIAGGIESPTGGWAVSGRYLVDVVTAASPDIVASASPAWTEVRHAGSLEGTLTRGDLGGGVNASASVEPDYVSLSAGVRGTLDLNEKNISLLLGYSFRHDTIGRSGTPFEVFHRELVTHTLSGGLTAVINRSAIASASADVILERGDPSKPYRYVPIFAEGMAQDVPPGASVDLVSALRLHARPIEALPQERDRYALTGRLAYRFRGATLRVEERLYVDTWGIKASTTDLRYLFEVGERVTLWPHLRVHVQSGAGFWRRVYEVSAPGGAGLAIPEIRTGDRELGPLQTLTGGGGATVQIGPRWAASLQVDGVFTHFTDALYLTHRQALFTALSVQAVYD